MCFFLASHPLFAQAHAYSLCICWALAMHLFPSFDTLQPFVVCTSDRWRGKQVWDGDVRLWRTADCKLASKRCIFFKRVKMMGCDSQLEHKQTCFSAKLDCNSRTKIFVLTVTGCYTLTLTNYIFVITGWYTLTNYIGHVLGWLVWAQSIKLSGAMLCKSGGSLYCIWV